MGCIAATSMIKHVKHLEKEIKSEQQKETPDTLHIYELSAKVMELKQEIFYEVI